MSKFIDFKDRQTLKDILSLLKADTPALWGAFKAQTMIEHLAREVQFTNGKKHCGLDGSEEDARIEKLKWVYSDLEIPKLVVVAPPEAFLHLAFPDLKTAIDALFTEIDDFELYYRDDRNKTAIHPAFGALNYSEWVIWHGKHFTHHFKQFGLISD